MKYIKTYEKEQIKRKININGLLDLLYDSGISLPEINMTFNDIFKGERVGFYCEECQEWHEDKLVEINVIDAGDVGSPVIFFELPGDQRPNTQDYQISHPVDTVIYSSQSKSDLLGNILDKTPKYRNYRPIEIFTNIDDVVNKIIKTQKFAKFRKEVNKYNL